ncbi:MAG: response regulator [Chloroflexia bacterium]|nr:response regulator [Chloroflexia bacterium]
MDERFVLIVDDHQNWREVLEGLLEDEYVVTTAKDYSEALAALKGQDPPFHVAVVDIRLEDADPRNEQGLDLVFELNQMGLYTKTIVLTGYSSVDRAIKALRDLFAYKYLEKTPLGGQKFDLVEFRNIVREAAAEAEARRQSYVFVLMPFDEKYDQIYQGLIKVEVERNNLACLRADDFFEPRWIMDDIEKSILEAKFLVADFSGRNANVFYEVGLAHAVGQPVVLITQNLEDVPPKLKQVRCIVYQDTYAGAPKLRQALKKPVQELAAEEYGFVPLYPLKKYESDPSLCFCLMPQSKNGEDKAGEEIYELVIQEAAKKHNLRCECAASGYSANNIMDEIWAYLNRARLVVADLSGRDPDVFYLLGIAHGLKKDVVLLARDEQDVPFDLRGRSCLTYTSPLTLVEGRQLTQKLAKGFAKVLGEPLTEEFLLSPADREALIGRLANAPGWKTRGYEDRYGFLLDAGLPDRYLQEWQLGGPPRATAARVIQNLKEIGTAVLSDDVPWCALGLLVKALYEIGPDVESRGFLSRLIREYHLTSDPAWLDPAKASQKP